MSKNWFFILAFIEGSSVMAIELLGAKMIAPFYGNSLFVWTSVLGITLAGLASGYYLGGFVSRKFPKTHTIFYVFMIAAFWVVIMPFWANFIMKATLMFGYEMGSIVSCLCFLFPPMVFHGMIPPVLINLITEDIDRSGSVSGNVYAISTIGGVLMTFFTGFFVIPYFGLKPSTFTMAVILAIVPFIYFLREKILISVGIIFFSAILISIGMSHKPMKKNSHIKILHKSDGLLGQILIADDLNTQKRSLLINNISQTFMHNPTGRAQWKYVHRIALYSSIKPAGSKVLVCGLGGGNLINELNNLDFETDAVEIDERMEKAAKKYFRMTGNVNVIVDDARHYIRTSRKKYDIIVLDMSAGENQPSNIYTVECFREIQGILNSGGIMFIHYQNVLEGEYALAVKSIGKTLLESGFYAKLIETQPKQDKTSELMLFASLEPVDLDSYSFERRDKFADPFNFPRDSIFIEDYDFSDGIVLTDDAPVMDFLHKNTFETTREATIKTLIPIFLKEKMEIL
ncbi:MAG: fused MFS/spermidine synthase [Bacteroidota bacterium]